MKVESIVLEGLHVRLEPLAQTHVDDLFATSDESLWRWNPRWLIQTREDMHAYVRDALRQQAEGSALPFATIGRTTGRCVGSTRFAEISTDHRQVEIGYTWIASDHQRTPINTEAKYLMLRHAFEVWGCIRVAFRTDALNDKSHAALLRIGAKKEGVARHDMITRTGRRRDSILFSILDTEWPMVKRDLETKLAG